MVVPVVFVVGFIIYALRSDASVDYKVKIEELALSRRSAWRGPKSLGGLVFGFQSNAVRCGALHMRVLLL